MRILSADRGDAGRRLDLVLRRHLADVPGATRTKLQAWIAGGFVTVDGVRVTRAAARMPAGSTVAIAVDGLDTQRERTPRLLDGRDPGIAADGWTLEPQDILYEDECLLAVAKPAGIVVHPTYRHAAGTLLDGVFAYGRDWPDSRRPSIVGRLDKLTSGVVIVAKGADAHAGLQRALRVGEKDYLAAVHGRVKPTRGVIDLSLGRDPDDRRRVIASRTRGAPSLTRFERLARGDRATLLRCRLVTGRMHQIRVHLAARGWPIVGDPKYGAVPTRGTADGPMSVTLDEFPRQALHAWRAVFRHPASGARVGIEAPVPEDLARLLARILGPCWPDTLPPLASASLS